MRHKRAIPKYRKHTPTKRIKHKVVKPNVVFKPHRKVKAYGKQSLSQSRDQHRKLPKSLCLRHPSGISISLNIRLTGALWD